MEGKKKITKQTQQLEKIISRIKQYSDFCKTSYKKDRFSGNYIYFWVYHIKIYTVFVQSIIINAKIDFSPIKKLSTIL